MTSLKVNLTNQSRGKTPSVSSIPSLKLGTDIFKQNPFQTEDVPSKSLLQELQEGMQILKENTHRSSKKSDPAAEKALDLKKASNQRSKP